jgi:hypothetical protein
LFFLAADCAAKEGKQQEPFGGGTNSHEIAEHATKAVEELAGALEAGTQPNADAVSRGQRTLSRILPAEADFLRSDDRYGK